MNFSLIIKRVISMPYIHCHSQKTHFPLPLKYPTKSFSNNNPMAIHFISTYFTFPAKEFLLPSSTNLLK
jgi:hypothetical protein